MSLENVLQWRSLAETWAQKFPILSPNEILASIYTESSGNPLAFDPGDPSWGLGSVTAPIAAFYGKFAPGDDSWKTDPEKNMACFIPFLAHLKEEFGSVAPPYGWVGAYNCGETQFRKGFHDAPYIAMWTDRLMQVNAALQ